jgi:hypothetical protein
LTAFLATAIDMTQAGSGHMNGRLYLSLTSNIKPLSITFWDWVSKNTFITTFPELPSIYLSRDINSVSELYGQRFCNIISTQYPLKTSMQKTDIFICLEHTCIHCKEHTVPSLCLCSTTKNFGAIKRNRERKQLGMSVARKERDTDISGRKTSY